MKTTNDLIAVTPFPTNHVQSKPQAGGYVLTAKHKTEAVPLKVLFDSADYQAGDTVWVRGDEQRSPWAVGTLELGGKLVCMLPKGNVLAWEPSSDWQEKALQCIQEARQAGTLSKVLTPAEVSAKAALTTSPSEF